MPLQLAESGSSFESAKDDSGVFGTFARFPDFSL